MSKVKVIQDISNITTLDDLVRYSSIITNSIVSAVNGGLDFTDNCNVSNVSVTFPAANVQVKVTHTLNRIPQGYLVAGRATNLQVFDGTSAMNSSEIFVQSSAAGTAKLLIY